MFDSLINKVVKVSYFNYRNDIRTERWIIARLISQDDKFIQIEGVANGTIFTINKEHIIEIVEEKHDA